MGLQSEIFQTLKGLIPNNPKALRVYALIIVCAPGLSLRSNPGLKLANAFGVCGSYCTAGRDDNNGTPRQSLLPKLLIVANNHGPGLDHSLKRSC
jgi:hypothetical protein